MSAALPVSAVDPLAAECALAAIGLRSVLDGTPTWNVLDRQKAAQLPKVARKLLGRFIGGADRTASEDLPTFDTKEVDRLLAEGPGEKQALALQAAIKDPKLGLAVATVATRIVHQLQPLYPRRTRLTASQGAVAEKPGRAALADFARVWSVACDPFIVLRDLLEGSLSPDMVRALENLWPNLYAMVQALIPEVVANLKAKRPSWELDARRDRALGVLQGKMPSTSDLSLAADFQQLNAQAQKPAPPTPRPLAIKSTLATPGQTDAAAD